MRLRLIALIWSFITTLVIANIIPVTDLQLCGPSATHLSVDQCYEPSDRAQAPISCDKRKHQPQECMQYVVDANTGGWRSRLSVAFLTADDDSHIRRITVKSSRHSYENVSTYIDSLLTTRVWMLVRDEFLDVLDSTDKNQTAGEVAISHETMTTYIDKYKPDFEKRLRYLASVNYPDSDTCRKTVLMLSRQKCSHPGYAGVLGMYRITQQHFRYSVTAVYVSDSNSVNESTAFIGMNDGCMEKNRWLCAFLPSTNCTLPRRVTNCAQRNCVANIEETHYFASLFYNGSFLPRNNTILSEVTEAVRYPLNEMQHYWSRHENDGHFINKLPPNKLSEPHPNAPQKMVRYEPIQVGEFDVFFEFAYLMRLNAKYRQLVNARLESFRKENQIDFRDQEKHPCVAVQIRRGDRILKASKEEVESFCKDHPDGGDKGCRSIPFEFIGLVNVTRAARILVPDNVRNLVVMTDDEAWLQEQKTLLKQQDSEWNVYDMRAPWLEDGDYSKAEEKFKKQGRSGLMAGVHLFSSMALLQQCQAFIGHFDSGVPWMLYAAMCHQHGGTQGICPAMMDLRTIQRLY